MATLQLSNVSAAIAAGIALEHIDLSVDAGEVAVVIGPNGAGKTSLLRAICNDLPLGAGSILCNGRATGDWPVERKATWLSVLPQRSTLDFPFTVEEVAALGRIPHDTSSRRNREIALAALELVDCGQLSRRLYLNLSGGEKQRVQLARVAAQIWEAVPGARRCLILDEPTASLDLAHQAMIVDMLRYFAGQGVAILAVLHDLNLAARCAHRILVLDRGRTAAVGAPREVLTGRLLSEVFQAELRVEANPLDGRPLVIT